MKRIHFFIFNTLFIVISSLIFRGIDIYFSSYIAIKIGKEMLGVYHLVMTVYLFGITLATSGINLSITRIVSEELANNRKEKIPLIMKKAFTITLFTSLCTSFIIFCNSNFIIAKCLNNRVSKDVIYLFSLALPLISMSSAISGYFTGIRRAYKNSIGQFIEHVAKVVITAFIINIFLPKGINYACFSLILGDLISEIISFIYIYLIYLFDSKKYITQTSYSSNINYTKKILKISFPIAVTSCIRSGLNSFKQLIIPSCLEKSGINIKSALSNYGIINGMAIPIILFPDILVRSFSTLLIPEFARYHTKKDYKRQKEITIFLLLSIILLSILLTITLALFSNKIALFFYKDISIGYFIKIFSPLAIFIYVDTVVDSILKGLDAQFGVMVINIFDLIINTIFIYIFVPKLGLNGYIISIYFSEILNCTISFFELIYIINKPSK